MDHVKSVVAIYEAFGRGDLPGILAHVSEDVDWDYGQADSGVPWLKHRRGHAGVAAFLGALGEGTELLQFQPKEILAGDSVVVALVDLRLRVRATGREVAETDEVHVWRFGPSGQVVAFRHALDSAQQVAALAG